MADETNRPVSLIKLLDLVPSLCEAAEIRLQGNAGLFREDTSNLMNLKLTEKKDMRLVSEAVVYSPMIIPDQDNVLPSSIVAHGRAPCNLVRIIFLAMSKSKHETTGLTPEPASRKLRTDDDKEVEKQEEDKPDHPMHADPMTRLVLEELQSEMAGYKNQTAYLMAQHSDTLREKAKREILVGGWSSFKPDGFSPEEQGFQLEAQAESRERFIKDIAKRAGLSSFYYQDWRFSHQTKGDALSPLTVVTVTQPWQRSKLLDFTKNRLNADMLKERHFVKDHVENSWEKIQKAFGPCQDKDHKAREIRVQPQVSLWDRTTGLPLKVAMAVVEMWGITFRHSWRDHTLTTAEGEYILWCHYLPAAGKMVLYLSRKLIQDPENFKETMIDKFNELLNYNGKSKGKGKGKSKSAASQESEQNSFPANHTSHSTNAKFPFTITFALVADEIDHWGTWKELWNRALTNANTPYQIHVLSEDF